MKVVIIGGGIGGLTLGILLRRRNKDVVICEKSNGLETRGHAFLMSADGLSILSEFFNLTSVTLKKQMVNLFSLKRPSGEEEIKIKLDGWYCMKRVDLLTFLYSMFDNNILKMGRTFSHFLYKNSKAVAAVFENGEVEYGDIFIGADGSNSKVREAIFEKVNFTNIEVKEVVGVSKRKVTDHEYYVFQKFQSKEIGLAFGYIPISLEEVVWFMQYDVNLAEGKNIENSDQLKKFCLEMTKHFPVEVSEVLNANDFSSSYIWNTRDFEILPKFHKNNIAIIGDAAHLALPFTSAGTTNAILDAHAVDQSLNQFEDIEKAFDNYYTSRFKHLKEHIEQGRELKKLFLNPHLYSERGFIIPLISDKDKVVKPKVKKPLKILYFTDPICSTCWVIQPILRKLMLEYDEYIEFEYRMGGLLPSWDDYTGNLIKNPADAAKHWEDTSFTYDMPLDGDLWLEDPLDSSYPPSIAFKAAQLQDNDKAISFLRRLKELIFLEKKNISRWEIIEKAALTSGLDSALLLKDIKGSALQMFIKDLKLAQDLQIKLFPTLFFSKEGGQTIMLKGYQPYQKFESVINQLLPDVLKKDIDIDAESLFIQFNNMTESEFVFLKNTTIESAREMLDQLHQNNKIRKFESKNGVVWIYNKQQ